MTDDAALDLLLDERALTLLFLKFGRCLDTGDWAGWRSCLTDVVNVDFKRLTGSDEMSLDAQLWTAAVALSLERVRRHHTYTNFNISIDGDRAHAVVCMTARHWAPTDTGVSHNTQYGWYDFYVVRTGSGWLIEKYKHDFPWIDGNVGVFDIHAPELADLSGRVFSPEHVEAARSHPIG